MSAPRRRDDRAPTRTDATASVRRRLAQRAFTLVELLVVVFIMALMAGIATVSSSDDDGIAAELACQQVTDAIERAQAMAFSSRTGYGVTFDTEDDCFAVVDENGELAVHPITKAAWEVDFLRPGQPKRIDVVSADFGDAGSAVVFDSRGVPLSGGTVVISRDGVSRTLTVDGATGRVTISGG